MLTRSICPPQETVNVAFRLSPSPAATALVKALVSAPRLHTLYTQLPSVWNTTLLEVRISCSAAAPPSHSRRLPLFLRSSARSPLASLHPVTHVSMKRSRSSSHRSRILSHAVLIFSFVRWLQPRQKLQQKYMVATSAVSSRKGAAKRRQAALRGCLNLPKSRSV